MAAMTKRLYALAAGLGMVERTEREDAFHQLVYGITGKEHVSELTETEAKEVEAELLRRMRFQNQEKPLKKRKKKDDIAGMMTEAQKRYAWYLTYRLQELDEKNPPVPAKKRLAGAVEKVLDVTAPPDDPLVWVKFADGSKLIESLKRYVRSAERRAKNKKAGA